MNKYSIPQLCEINEQDNPNFIDLVRYEILTENKFGVNIRYYFKEWYYGRIPKESSEVLRINKKDLIEDAIVH